MNLWKRFWVFLSCIIPGFRFLVFAMLAMVVGVLAPNPFAIICCVIIGVIYITHLFIEKYYISHLAEDTASWQKHELNNAMVVKTENGKLLKVDPERAAWGKGEKYCYWLPNAWKERPGAVLRLSKGLSVPYNNVLVMIRFVFDIHLKDEFSAKELYDIISKETILIPDGEIKDGMYIGGHLNLLIYLGRRIHFEEKQGAVMREDIVRYYFEGSRPKIELLKALANTIRFDYAFSSIKSSNVSMTETIKSDIVLLQRFTEKEEILEHEKIKAHYSF